MLIAKITRELFDHSTKDLEHAKLVAEKARNYFHGEFAHA